MNNSISKILARGSIRGNATFSKPDKPKFLKQNKYKFAKKLQTPNWLSIGHLNKIKSFYLIAKELTHFTGTTYEVDHIVPLQGEFVSGLHVPWNLQVITKSSNASKRNNFSDS